MSCGLRRSTSHETTFSRELIVWCACVASVQLGLLSAASAARPRQHRRFDRFVQLTEKLVTFRAVSQPDGHTPNAELIAFLQQTLDDKFRGAPPELYESHKVSAGADGHFNLIVRIGPKSSKHPQHGDGGLILCGHTDVVSAAEVLFTPRLDGDRLYGRGTTDMQGFNAIAVALAEIVDLERMTQPLVLIFTGREEIGTLGAAHLVKHWQPTFQMPSNCLVGEPTHEQPAGSTAERAMVLSAHGGHEAIQVRALPTDSVHSSVWAPNNAGMVTMRLGAAMLNAQERLRLELNDPELADLFPSPHPLIQPTAGQMTGGSTNTLPQFGDLGLSVRLVPGTTSQQVVDILLAEALSLGLQLGQHYEIIRPTPDPSPAYLTPDGTAALDYLHRIHQQDKRQAATFAADAGRLAPWVNSVIWGPGNKSLHTTTENINLDSANRYMEQLEAALEHFGIPLRQNAD